MTSTSFADSVVLFSMLISLATYIVVSRCEGSYLNILTPSFVIAIPAYYLLPIAFTHVFGNDASRYAIVYVYATLATENVCFAFAYLRPKTRVLRLPFRYSHANFDRMSFVLLGLAALMYVPVLLQFPEYIFSPREIYAQTRTGFGINFYISSTLAYVAVILIAFSQRSRWIKVAVGFMAAVVLFLHGSKGQILSLLFLITLFEVYVRQRKVKLVAAAAVTAILGVVILLSFAATMALEGDPIAAVQTISQYSDYTRNAMLVIDSNYPVQYGRLTLEGHFFGRIPRLVMPNKPKDFGAFRLDEEFFPKSQDADAGAPDFGIGLQYADFGEFAIVFLAMFGLVRGWLARVFVDRLNRTRHPADFVMVAFLANVSVFPVGGVGWLLPETVALAMGLRWASCFGAAAVYREKIRYISPSYPGQLPAG